MVAAKHAADGGYHPRRARFQNIVEVGQVAIKLNAIVAEGKEISDAVFEKAASQIASFGSEIAATNHQGAGFAILHEGEEGRWLLLHWWLDGGIVTRKLWRADLIEGSDFADTDPLLMACVWELGIVDFERRAWMRTMMSGGSIPDYLNDRFAEGSV